MLQIDDDRLSREVYVTRNLLESGNREFIKREYDSFILLNGSLFLNFPRKDYDLSDLKFRQQISHSLKRLDRNAFWDYMYFMASNKDLLIDIGDNVIKLANEIKYKNIPYFDACKKYNEKQFVDIILSYYATYGNKIYSIVKKFFDEKRINMKSIPLPGNAGYYSHFVWLNSGYIFSKYSDYGGSSLANVVHELGHAIDAELFIFSQQKKNQLFNDMFVEIPAISFETGFYDYLQDTNIDKPGGMILANNRATNLFFNLERVNLALSDENLMVYENGLAKDSKGYGYQLRKDLLYGIGSIFALHLNEIRKTSTKDFLKILNNLTTMRKEMTLEDAIEMTGFDLEDFISCRAIKPRLNENCLTLKKRYNLL